MLTLLGVQTALSQQCVDDTLCIRTKESSGVVQFYVHNLKPTPITVIFDVESRNMTSSVDFPFKAVYPPATDSPAFRLDTRDKKSAGSYTYKFRWLESHQRREQCIEEMFCIDSEDRGDAIHVYLENLKPYHLGVKIKVVSEDMVPSSSFPMTIGLSPKQRKRSFTMIPKDIMKGGSYRYEFTWVKGNLLAEESSSTVYQLPYASGTTHKVMQGPNGTYSHKGIHAIDWDMPENTQIHAARAGMVVEVEDRYEEGGVDEKFRTRANRIVVEHVDGTLSSYAHLKKHGVFVREGQRIQAGQIIGLSGNTGFSSAPHLHFEVYRVNADLAPSTIPVVFLVAPGKKESLREGVSYTSIVK